MIVQYIQQPKTINPKQEQTIPDPSTFISSSTRCLIPQPFHHPYHLSLPISLPSPRPCPHTPPVHCPEHPSSSSISSPLHHPISPDKQSLTSLSIHSSCSTSTFRIT